MRHPDPTTSAMPLQIRPGAPSDILALARLWAMAFPGERSVEIRAQQLRDGGIYGGIETCWIAEQGGRLAGAFRIYDFALSLCGIPCRTLGLAAVAVDPVFRRQGVGQRLCEEALRIGRDRGDLVAALFPFRSDFYGRMGFTPAGSLLRHRFSPEVLRVQGEAGEVRGIAPEARRPAVPALYADLLARLHGPAHRSDRMWDFLDEEETLVWGVPSPSSSGLDAFLIAKSQPSRGSRGTTLVVRELLARTPSALEALWSWVAVQGDQWSEVVYDALPGERFEDRLRNPRLPGSRMTRGLWFPTGTLLRGPMLRVLNLPELLQRLGFSDSGATLHAVDPLLPENSGVWSGEGPVVRILDSEASRAWTPEEVAAAVVDARLPGLHLSTAGRFRPLHGVPDFRLLDVF